MPHKAKAKKVKGAVATPQSQAATGSMTLDSLQQRFRNTGTLGHTDEERRRAWLYLLDVAYQPIAEFPAVPKSSETSDVPSTSDRSGGASSVDGTPSLVSDYKDESLEEIVTPSGPASISGSLIESSSKNEIPLDREGWQTGYTSELLDTDGRRRESNGLKPPTDEWQVAESKRSRRRRGTYDSRAMSTAGDGTSQDDSGIFGSVVDLGKESSKAFEGHDSPLRLGSSPPSSAVSKSTNGPALPSAYSSTIAFAPLADDGESRTRLKKTDKRKRKKQPGSTSNGHEAREHGNGSHVQTEAAQDGESVAEAELYKLRAQFSDDLPPHRDERQVELDILRSFLGPISTSSAPLGKAHIRDLRRRQLQDVVVGVLRRHPSLNYYQGYHDVLSTLLLMLSPHHPTTVSLTSGAWASEADYHLVLEACERFSLFYLRDFMTLEIGPCMGWLKVLRNLLRQVDPTMSKVIEQASTLPFFALSWLITLLSHDLQLGGPELNKVFDFILMGGPEMILWTVAALLLQSRDELVEGGDMEVGEMDDPALLHHTLSKLPKQVTSGKSSIDDIIISATSIRGDAREKTSDPRKGVMGSQSVLYTWSPPSEGPESGGVHSSPAEWQVANALVEEYLSSPLHLQKIVLDPNPTPPAVEDSRFDLKAREKGKRAGRKASKVGGGKGGAGAALLVGVVVVAGAALFLGGHTMDRHQKSKLAHDLSDLGKGLVSLAFCAAGACK